MSEQEQGNTEEQQMELAEVPISPVPVHVNVGIAQLPQGMQVVLLHISSPEGNKFFFLPPDYAKATAEQMLETAEKASSGLIVAKNQIEIAR